MRERMLPVAIAAIQRTNDILGKYSDAMIGATEIKLYLTDVNMQQIEQNAKLLWNEDNYIQAIESNYEYINLKKLLLYCYHKVHSMPDFLKKRDDVENTEKYLYKLASTLIPTNQNVSMYAGNMSDNSNRYNITVINSNSELYNKPQQARKLKLDSIFNAIIDRINIDDMAVTINDAKLTQTMQCYVRYNSLIKAGVTKSEILRISNDDMDTMYTDRPNYDEYVRQHKREVYAIPEIRAKLDEDNLYAIAAYRISEQLELYIQDYKENKEKDNNYKSQWITAPTLMQFNKFLSMLCDNISPKKVTMALSTDGGQSMTSFNLQECKERWKEDINILTNIFIYEDPIQAYNPQILPFLGKESAMKLLDKQEDKSEYYFTMYQAGLVSFNEMIEYEKSINPEYDDAYRVRAVVLKLTHSISIPSQIEAIKTDAYISGNKNIVSLEEPVKEKSAVDKLCEPENFFSSTLEDNSLYEMMNEQLFKLFAYHSMEQLTQNGEYAYQAKKNIDVMVKRNKFTPEIILSLYIYKEATFEDLEKTLGIDKLEELYDADDFMDTLKKVKELKSESELSEDEKNLLQIIQEQYKFYVELFNRLGYLGNEDKEIELLDYLGDMIDDKDTLKELYLDGLLSIENLHGINKELVSQLYEDNILRDEDKKYIILHTNAKATTGDLIRLSNSGSINAIDVFNMYMQGRYSLEVLKDFSEGLNTNTILNSDDLIKKAKKYGVVKDKDVIEDFQRYLAAYLGIKGKPDDEIKSKIYKAIGGKNAKNQRVIELYGKGLINIQDIDITKDTLLIDMIKQGVLSAEDEEFLFRDTNKEGKKYLRLTKILPFLTPDQKINILASVYGDADEISTPRIAFLSTYLEEAVEDKRTLSDKQKNAKTESQDDEEKKSKASEKTKNLFAFGEKFKAFKEIDANYKHEVASGSYVIYFEELDTIVLEEIYRTTSNGNDFYNTQHATYIIKSTTEVLNELGLDKNNDFYDEFIKKLVYQNSRGVNSVDWSRLIKMNKDKVKGTAKCLHTTEERWKNTLRRKMGLSMPDKKEKIVKCLENIEGIVPLDNDEQEL